MGRYLHSFFRGALKRRLSMLSDENSIESDTKLPYIRGHPHVEIGCRSRWRIPNTEALRGHVVARSSYATQIGWKSMLA